MLAVLQAGSRTTRGTYRNPECRLRSKDEGVKEMGFCQSGAEEGED